MSEEQFDVSIARRDRGGNTIQLAIPAALGRALIERGFNRAKLRVTAEGILLIPYHSDVPSRTRAEVELPDWNGQQ